MLSIETINPSPPPPDKDYIFERVEANCELRFKGEVLKEMAGFNDFYGEGSAVKTAIEEMKAYAKKRGIDSDSELEVVVVKVTSQFRAKPTDGENFYAKEFFNFRSLDIYTHRGLPEPVETVVWSSKI